uniref:wall-associated receptor kinase 3-like n=1 Tax=Fragaria vesca subsp. vesca TaxID=101020 RepID=UPI0005C94849
YAGVSIGLLVIFVGISWICCGIKRRQYTKLKERYFKENGGLLLLQQLASHGGTVETTKIFSTEELEKATNNYHESRVLGEGGYGTVYKGILPDDKVVAIKKSKGGAPTQSDQFVNEVIVLSQINHRNVVKLLGCCLETEVPLLVYEFITNGTLYEHIHKKRSSLSFELRMRIAVETSEALAYLHSSTSNPIIHRDVKAENILLDDSYTAKVSDFGASRLVPSGQTEIQTLVLGTFGYLDPEYLQSNQLTEKSDVYSFDVVLVELLTSIVALSKGKCLTSIFLSSMGEGRLNQILDDDIVNEGNIETIKKVANLSERCLRVKGEERPTMKEVAMELERMRITSKHPWGTKVDFCPEENEYLLGSLDSDAYVLDVTGGNGSSSGFTTGTTSGFMTHISLEGELQIIQEIAYDCYNDMNEPLFSNNPSLSLPTPYTISDTKNKFIVVGCDALALFQGHRGDENYTTGCMSICDDNVGSANASCSGIGCCQTSIPSGLQSLGMKVSSFYNHSYITSHCGYALIVQEEKFTYSGNKSITDLLGIEQLPMVVNWGIGDAPCDAAEKKLDYACKKNSECVNRTITIGSGSSGYFGQCLPGYEGNPYLPDGCQDIDECEANPCNGLNGVCLNTPGNYSCLCSKGYKNNGPNGKCIKDNSSNRLLLIVLSLGISVGLFVILLAGSLWMYWGLKKRKFIKLKEKYFTENGGLLLQQKLTSQGGSVETTKLFTAEELEKATNNYHESRILGEGGYGTVYRGILLDNRVVAIKKSKVGAPTQTDQFVNEVIVLSQINHRNVVRLLGCCLETEVPLLVYEFITQGTLFEHIHKNKGKGSLLSWELRLKIASETAGALAYLHSSTSTPIIHRDVMTMNIVLDDNYTAKVSDFGASRFIPIDQTQLATLVQGTFGYLDPEYLRVKGEERPTMREVAMELEGMIMTKHPWGSAGHNFPEETMHLLGSPNTFMDYIVNVDGDGGPGTTSGCDSMQLELLNSYADGR